MTEIVVFGNDSIFGMNGYSYAFQFYRVLSQKYQVKVIVPRWDPFLKEERTPINPHLSLQVFVPSISFFWENQRMIIYHFAEIADKDRDFVEKVKEAVGDACVIIADSFLWGRFIARVFPDRRLIMRSLDVQQLLLKEYHMTIKVKSLAPKECYDRQVALVAAMEKETVQNAEHIMVLTKGDAECLSALYEVPSEKFSLLPVCAYNIEAYRGFRPEKQWNLNGKLNVFFIGFLDNWMAFQAITEAAAVLPEITFHICGRDVADKIKMWEEPEKELPENVLIYGEVSDERKRELIQYCDCALNLAGQTCGMNTKLLDYMLYGTPIISTRMGVRGYALREYEHYFPCELDELCVQLQKFAMLPGEERKRMADAAYDLLFRDHDYEKYWSQIEKRLGLNAVPQDREVLKNKYIVFGCGVMGERALCYLNRAGSCCIGLTDNNAEMHGKTFQGYPVFPPEEAFRMINEGDIHLMIATMTSLYLIEMYRQAAKWITNLEKLDIYFRDKINPPEIEVKLLLDAPI